MGIKLRFKAKADGDVVKVKGLIKHPMLSYDMAKKQGKEANFLTYITAEHNGEVVFEANTTQFLSKNPVLKFAFKGGKSGDSVKINVEDLKGNKASKEFKIK